MWKIETLPSVSEYKPSTKAARVAATNTPSTEAAAGHEVAEKARTAEPNAVETRKLEQALGNVTAHVQNLHRSLHFSVDEKSGETVVRVVDSETQEVIRQIPSEELLAIADRLRSTAGVLLTEQV
jgi:flagellar protein FlaG